MIHETEQMDGIKSNFFEVIYGEECWSVTRSGCGKSLAAGVNMSGCWSGSRCGLIMHGYRREYARERYKELAGWEYDRARPERVSRATIREVSENLGYNREDVVTKKENSLIFLEQGVVKKAPCSLFIG